ncbi:hypothetical protein [Streptomyces sp. wa1071]|uniref:hypothetical protein n=1 Tax=Streptomyces sp. wa1071 TaxID=1828217 RepID=UPI0015CF4985|nr:hypothetical protein [Streptomyces sp. wa1071]
MYPPDTRDQEARLTLAVRAAPPDESRRIWADHAFAAMPLLDPENGSKGAGL